MTRDKTWKAGFGVLAVLSAVNFVAPLALPAAEQAQPTGEVRHITDTEAMQQEVAAFERTFTNQVESLKEQGKREAAASRHDLLWTIAGFGLIGSVIGIRYLPRLLAARDVTAVAQLAASAAAAQVTPQMAAEEKEFSDFAVKFGQGPRGSGKPAADERPVLRLKHDGNDSQPAAGPTTAQAQEQSIGVKPGLPGGPPQLIAMMRLIEQIGEISAADAGRFLADLNRENASLKAAAQDPKLLPAWQIATALEALVQQFISKPQTVTPSTLRTAAAAMELIEALFGPNVRSDLTTNPPIRVLAVDDDPISRHAVSFALKKALNLPELANNGESALELATQNTYDAIFLDVQMPGMDGFELCGKIRQTGKNQDTPIVFITCHSDFETQAKSTAVGGRELIAKPFLTFEVALKALTLVVRTRLNVAAMRRRPARPELAGVPA